MSILATEWFLFASNVHERVRVIWSISAILCTGWGLSKGFADHWTGWFILSLSADFLNPNIQCAHKAVSGDIDRFFMSEMSDPRCSILTNTPVFLFLVTGKEFGMMLKLTSCVDVNASAIRIEGLFARITAAGSGSCTAAAAARIWTGIQFGGGRWRGTISWGVTSQGGVWFEWKGLVGGWFCHWDAIMRHHYPKLSRFSPVEF